MDIPPHPRLEPASAWVIKPGFKLNAPATLELYDANTPSCGNGTLVLTHACDEFTASATASSINSVYFLPSHEHAKHDITHPKKDFKNHTQQLQNEITIDE
jgi:hypothetical protein